MTQEKKRQIAKDHHFSKLSIEEIGEKYGVSSSTATQIADKIHPLSVAESKFDKVLKLKNEDYNAVLHILKENEINYEEVGEFSLEEYYHSKI